MDTQVLQSIKDILEKDESFGIIVGKNPNLDQMAAALSLYLCLKQVNKNVAIACPTDPLVEISSLVGINKVKRALEGEGGDLVVSFPYQEGEIEKVSYTLEEGSLNIIVKAGENGLSFTNNDVKFKRGSGAPKNLFVIGTPRLSDLGELFDPQALKDTKVVNIDNKKENQGFGDIVFVSQNYSSVSEQIVSLLQFLGVDLDIDMAQNLLSGISFGTNNFADPKTSMFAFEAAANLMKKGAVRKSAQLEKPAFTPTFDKTFDKSLDDDFGFDDEFPQVAPKPQFKGQSQVQQSSQQPKFQPKWNQPKVKSNPFGGFKQNDQNNKPFQRPQQSQPSQQNQSFQQPNFPKPQQPKPAQNSTFNKQNTPLEQVEDEETPPDWLTPKIYKGSSSIE